ncbi:heavy-metal-associated domain-containing protein [Nesterenkonia flava]|uniref:Heavy metal-associated domain-containing protein n=1 Tax=Nesterenkonia flava TaxID=469799 RepID=A0ABU1FXS8_9MICC|nr:heavy metal-associated domain-containing protein [Nesterenkonia flava]MDR5713062.1 heavy metal-associated domain-containing protein [Nesterenkonia flava]
MSTTTTYTVTGMTCGHCESSIRAEVSQLPGVTGVDVSATTGVMAVTAENAISDADVIAAVDEAGYTAARS